MIPTIEYIQNRFDEFNRQMFDGKLPAIPIKLSDAKTFLGRFSYRKIVNRSTGKVEYVDLCLRVNARVDLPENMLEDVIIHEMIHYYIAYYHLEDVSTHGTIFIQMMNAINQRFGRHVSVSFKSTPEQREQLEDTRQRYHVIAVLTFHDGTTGFKVLPRIIERIVYYYNNVSAAPQVKEVSLFMSNSIFFNKYPNSSSLRYHRLDADEIHRQLQGAEPMTCDGKTIHRPNFKP